MGGLSTQLDPQAHKKARYLHGCCGSDKSKLSFPGLGQEDRWMVRQLGTQVDGQTAGDWQARLRLQLSED